MPDRDRRRFYFGLLVVLFGARRDCRRPITAISGLLTTNFSLFFILDFFMPIKKSPELKKDVVGAKSRFGIKPNAFNILALIKIYRRI